MENEKVSLTRLAKGAIEERIDLEVAKIIDNILDLNTRPDKKRTLTLSIDFAPNMDRNHITMNAIVKSRIEPTASVQTSLALGYDRGSGEQFVVELVPNIPGQLAMNGEEQEPPKMLKVVR